MKTFRTKLIITGGFALFAGLVVLAGGEPATMTPVQTDETKAFYTKNCAACHLPKAQKSYDPAKDDDHHVEVIMKGKKAEKPPHMPGYEAKGMKVEDARALAEYMRALRAAN
jgi:mono/diheme cytochrome c family protein